MNVCIYLRGKKMTIHSSPKLGNLNNCSFCSFNLSVNTGFWRRTSH